MKNKSAPLKIRKNENILYLGNPWREKIHAKTFYLKKIEELMIKVSEGSERKMSLVVKGLE